jgi:hypothetical protein
MRAKFSYVLPGIIGLLMVVALSASAQDDVPGPSTSPAVSNFFNNDSEYDDKPLLMEQGSMKNNVLADTTRKVVPVPAAKAKSNTAGGAEKKPAVQGDPLNFNFLYYIMQKFKASELME